MNSNTESKSGAMWMKLAVTLVFTLWFCLTPTAFLSAQEENANSPFPMQSLIDGDTCTPPCWFGIVPGVSNTEDVRERFQQMIADELIGADLASLSENTRFAFFWPLPTWEQGRAFTSNTITIEHGLVRTIDVLMNHPVYLTEVLTRMGEPKFAFVNLDFEVNLTLVYPNVGVMVHLDTSYKECSLATIKNDLRVFSVEYQRLKNFEEALEFFRTNYWFVS